MAENRRAAIHGDLYEYTFKDPHVGELNVLKSDQEAWWSGEQGRVKIQKLVDAWKLDANDDEAIFYAGISLDQLKYFQKLHPDVYTIKHLCKQNLGLTAKKEFAKQVEKGEAALTYLRMKRKDEGYSFRIEATGANGRELLEGLTQQVRAMLLDDNDEYDADDQEHPGGPATGDTDAGAQGAGNEAAPAGAERQG